MAHRPPSPREADNLPLLMALTIACRVRPTTCAASPTVYTQFPCTGCVPRPGGGTRFLQTSVDDYCNRLGPVDVPMIAAATARMQIGRCRPNGRAAEGEVRSGAEADSVRPLR